MTSPTKPRAPSCDRNQGPIREVLLKHFSERRRVLEIGSGTGQHAVCFAAALPNALWQTSDVEENLPGIRLWLDDAALPNTPPPIVLDVKGPWPDARFDAVFTANTLHIMSWPEVQQLFAALDGVLEADAMLAVYGPFNYGGQFTSDSNRAFDLWLKGRSAVSRIRDFEAVNALANSIGLQLIADHAMPANNRTLVWQRQAHALGQHVRESAPGHIARSVPTRCATSRDDPRRKSSRRLRRATPDDSGTAAAGTSRNR